MPMEPQGYPEKKLEKNGLLPSDSNEQLTAKVRAYLQDVPYAVGANNHMGSRFTEHEEKMQTVLQLLKGQDMFFIDSRTSPKINRVHSCSAGECIKPAPVGNCLIMSRMWGRYSSSCKRLPR